MTLRGVSFCGVSLILGLGSLAACSDHKGSGDDDDGSGAVTLTIAPTSAMIALGPSAGGFSGSQKFTVTAKSSAGTTDVTDQVSWDVEDNNLTFDVAGTATVAAAGPYKIIAQYGGAEADATLTATLTASGTGDGWTDGDQGKLDGTPTGTPPTIAYPLGGALFPVNMTPIEIHTKKSDASQALARVELSSGTQLDYKFYAPCKASPNPVAFADACIVTVPDAIAKQLAGVSEVADIALSVRLAAADGSKLSESAPTMLAWSKVALTGGLYYWTTAAKSDTDFKATAVARFDFSKASQPPEIYLPDTKASTSGQCIGCHAVSPDGSKMSFSLGGSDPANFSLFDVGMTKSLLAAPGYMASKFAAMSTFSPDGSREVTMQRGVLTLRTADATLGVITDNLFADTVTEKVSHPFWGPNGGHLAFVSWTPSQQDITSGHNTGDMVQGGQIWITGTDGKQMTGTPKLLVPRADNVTSYYPAISDDDLYVVFNQSSCAGPANTGAGAWGAGACDGYNDISATLHVVPVNGGAPVALTKANGGDNPLTTNSWPRWSPDHGTFRGKRLYWLAYSSRRPYGLSLVGSQSDTTKPQLWFAAVSLDEAGSVPAADPSFAPVWLPGQNKVMSDPRGNHTPVWTSKVVIFE